MICFAMVNAVLFFKYSKILQACRILTVHEKSICWPLIKFVSQFVKLKKYKDVK